MNTRHIFLLREGFRIERLKWDSDFMVIKPKMNRVDEIFSDLRHTTIPQHLNIAVVLRFKNVINAWCIDGKCWRRNRFRGRMTQISIFSAAYQFSYLPCIWQLEVEKPILQDNFSLHKLSLDHYFILSFSCFPLRYTMDRPRFTDNLEAIKFICKDFWSELFKKQIDNLKTNHRVGTGIWTQSHITFVQNLLLNIFSPLQGTFVLQDNRFRWLAHMSIDPSVQASGNIQDPSAMAENKSAQATGMHLYFPCGIIRGALSNLGIACAVSADISNLPACEFLTLITFNSWSYILRVKVRA